jgi:hypothetical protein
MNEKAFGQANKMIKLNKLEYILLPTINGI